MTLPTTEFEFLSEAPPGGQSIAPLEEPEEEKLPTEELGYPPAILQWPPEAIEAVRQFLDERVREIIDSWKEKHDEWAEYEKAYRARPQGAKTLPFVGADNTVVPAIAMAVDPIHARLDTGIFKQKPVFTFQPLKRSVTDNVQALTAWVDFYQRHMLRLREVASPRLLELAKLGTCVFKTVYHQEVVRTLTYDEQFNEVAREVERFKGPRVFGVSAADLMYDAGYQHLQQCPMVVERQRTTYGALLAAQQGGQLANVEKIKDQEGTARSTVETAREEATKVKVGITGYDIEVYEVWFDYIKDGKLLKLVATYELDTRTLLQLRHNWYFHQRWPYTVIPYMTTNDSILGIGIAEMVKPFQDIITRFQQMSSDNAYLANIRMYIAKRDAPGIEDVPRLYAGRTFFVDDPSKDFIPFAAADIYPSTIQERQNLFGMIEKRTGVSDYLTGRESPILGSRATATSTLALIKEGLARVEEVMENVRQGLSEVVENCIYIWIQYGVGDVADLVFGDDEIYRKLQEFFNTISRDNVGGAISVDLSASDAATAPQAMQALQLQIIQIMMGYLEKLLAAGQAGLQAMQMGSPELADMIKDVMRAARQMFRDLLNKFDIRNPEDYLPDLEKYLQGGFSAGAEAAPGQGAPAGVAGQLGGIGAQPGIPAGYGTLPAPTPPRPATPGVGGRAGEALSAAGLR